MNEQETIKSSGSSRALATKHNETTGLSVLNLLDEKQLAQAEVFLKKIIASPKGGITNVQDGLAILMRAQDLQLPFSTCLEHIHVINNKTGVDIHIIKSLLLRAGVTWKCTKEYAPQYQYTDGNTIYLETQLPEYCVKCRTAADAEKATNAEQVGVYPLKWYTDLNNRIYNEFQVSDKCVVAMNPTHAQALAKEGKFPIMRIAAQPIDWVTEYEFYRYYNVAGKTKEVTAKSHFSYSEARVAGLLDKETYTKYARVLIGHRAFTLGARDIAADVIMGVMESTELKIVENVNLSPDDFENVEEIKDYV